MTYIALLAYAGWFIAALLYRKEISNHAETLDRFETYQNAHEAFREAAMRVIKDQQDNIKDLKDFIKDQ